MAQDYSETLAVLQQNLTDRSEDVRSAMNVVNELKTLIAQIQGLQNNYDSPQIVSDVSPPPTI